MGDVTEKSGRITDGALQTASHTPGPWRVRETDNLPDTIFGAGGEWVICAFDDDGAPYLHVDEGDLALILAAPELLAASDAIIDALSDLFCMGRPLSIDGQTINHTKLNKAGELARHAISKARGLSDAASAPGKA